MSERKWTPAQKNCIDARGGSVLVSAAAGSGKTSVLVERVIRRITDKEHPVDIDRMLIVTFTRAAAAEMKGRLSARLAAYIAEHPEDRRLMRQQMLLPSAAISTIHGFCTTFLRENFEAAGINPRFKVPESGDETLLRAEALEETLEVFYAAAEPTFIKLADLLNGRRDDSGLKAAILATYNFIQAQAYPIAWLREHIAVADPDTPLSDTVWGQRIRRFTAQKLGLFADMAAKAIVPLRECDGAEKYLTRLLEDAAVLQRAALTVSDPTNDWDTCIRAVASAIPATLPSAKGLPAAHTETVKTVWGIFRKEIRETLVPLFGDGEEALRQDLLDTAPQLTAFCDLIEAFSERYREKKTQKGLLDFNDLEHITLSLLRDPETGKPTELALETGRRYTEIFVDEYQDTNDVQDTIFRMLSCEDNSQFMVGDVKQSIYGFRQAMPQIFMDKRNRAYPYDGTHFPALITLGENFRSRKEVTGTVNFLFRQLMTKEFCGIEYAENEELIPSATYPELTGAETECLLFDHPYSGKEMSVDVAEARIMAARIRELIESGQVTENNRPRPVQYRDICILLRSRGSRATLYADELRRLGIPVDMDTGTPFFEVPVVQTALSLLRSIDNPLRDVSFMALLLSPIGGFTADDCARIRVLAREKAQHRSVALYTALLLAAEEPGFPLQQKASDMIERLRHFRRLAVSLPADTLLERLYEETALLAVAAAGPDGDQRVNDLRELMQYAKQYEQNGFRGLSAFVRYLDRLETEKKDLSSKPAPTGNNAISLMTIHGSKGLEFPIVLLPHLFGEFHRDTGKQPLSLHGTDGVAISGYNETDMTTLQTVAQSGIRLATRYTDMAEELRILYVAMTRAREKLICLFVKKNLPARLQKLMTYLPTTPHLDTARMLSSGSFGDWILLSLLRHPDAVLLRSLAGAPNIDTLPADENLCCRWYEPEELELTPLSAGGAATPDPGLLRTLEERLNYRYPFASLQGVPAKIAASELAHRELAADFVATRRPAFLAADRLTPAERGTALHTFMQFADYRAAAENPEKEADRLLADGFITEAWRQALDMAKITRFFQSGLYARIQKADRVWREYAFTVPLPAHKFDPTLPEGTEDRMIVQGIADCVFEENGELIIVDYKTDRVATGEELSLRYHKQLEVYRQALTDTLGLPVKQSLLYSFHLDKTVEI